MEENPSHQTYEKNHEFSLPNSNINRQRNCQNDRHNKNILYCLEYYKNLLYKNLIKYLIKNSKYHI